MSADPNAAEVCKELRRRGASADLIPESLEERTPTPDISATVRSDTVLIEVWTRSDDPVVEEAFDRELEEAGRAHHELLAVRAAAWTKGVDYAVRQLNSMRDSQTATRLLWIQLRGKDPADQADFARISLYGTAFVFDAAIQSPPDAGSGIFSFLPSYQAVEVRYFQHSDFYKHRTSLQGVVLDDGCHLQLLPNDASPPDELDRLLRVASSLAIPLADDHSRNDGRIIICRTDVDRRDKDAMLRYLSSAHGFQRPTLAPMKRHRIAVDIAARHRG